MKTQFAVCLSLGIGTLLLLAAPAYGADDEVDLDNPATIERGGYLVMTSACHDCHTPWVPVDGPEGVAPDMTRMLQGHPASEPILAPAALQSPWIAAISPTNTAWSGPWGVSFTANLTPDDETGLGKWTLRMFVDTIRNGRHKGRGRLLLPPMPAPMYKHFSDEDLTAIFAYLQSIPAIKNKVPDPVPPLQMSGMEPAASQ